MKLEDFKGELGPKIIDYNQITDFIKEIPELMLRV